MHRDGFLAISHDPKYGDPRLCLSLTLTGDDVTAATALECFRLQISNLLDNIIRLEASPELVELSK